MNTTNTTRNTAAHADQARAVATRIAYASTTIDAALQHMARKARVTTADIHTYLCAAGSEPGRRYFQSLITAAGVTRADLDALDAAAARIV